MDSPHTIGLFRGPEISARLDDVARLRIGVFRAWPYLYEGSFESEHEYLAAYARSKDSLFVLAFDEGEVIGASTGLPLADDTPEFHQPFVERGIAVESVFYFGESVLLPEYRGRGIGHAFFDRREAHARTLGGFRWTAFCSVDREDDDPRRPTEYRPNDAFWRKRGYQRRAGMTMHFPWEESGRGEVDHPLTFWLRELERTV
jgi:GNAT superfamily N-acetyltransferase